MDSNRKHIGIIGTVIFHTIIVLLIVFYGFTAVFPLPEEEGVLINFGVDPAGSGNIEPQISYTEPEVIPEAQPESEPEPESEAAPVVEEAKKEVLTQDYEETAAIEAKKRKEKEKEKERKLEQEKQKKILEEQEIERKRIETVEREKREEQERIAEEQRKVLEQQRKISENTKQAFGASPNDSKSKGEGVGNVFGNQGDPNGSPESTNRTGGPGLGKDGISFSLKGRTAQGGQLPVPLYPSKEEGVVVVKVKVDQQGNVSEAIWEPKGSTTTSKSLIDAATKAAQKAKFNQDNNSDLIQVGTITYRFNIR